MDLLSIKSLDELAQFLGYASYNKLKSLVYPLPKYRTFSIPKKNGGLRTINVPQARLKTVQARLAKEFTKIYGDGPSYVNSFLPRRSIVKNALPHCERGFVIRFDLEDFFGTINFGRIHGLLRSLPFGFPEDIAAVIAQICCFGNKLPQGAPTSPILSNFIAYSLDREMGRLARRFKARYTRYSDDLTLSLRQKGIHQLPAELVTLRDDKFVAGPRVRDAIYAAKFVINEEKTRVASSQQRQMVTGLIVNKGLGVPGKLVNQVRRALFVWEKSGFNAAEAFALPVLHRRHYASGKTPKLERVVRGKLLFIRMVKGASDRTYQNLALQFNRLIERDAIQCSTDPLTIDPRVISNSDAHRATWYLEAETTDGILPHDCYAATAFRMDSFPGWVTCAHCVGSIEKKAIFGKITLISSDWTESIPAQVTKCDWDRDIALLTPIAGNAIPQNAPYFRSIVDEVTNDQRVATIGFASQNLHQPPIFMRARVVRVRMLHGVKLIEIDKAIQKGNSGGALFDENYRVVGMVQEHATKDGGSNACVAINEINTLKV